jgi:chromosomal replication initiator protein
VSPEAASPYNPLVLHGRSGTGKSHVARGLASVWKTHHRRDRVVCTTAVEFAHELADAIDSQAVEDFRVKYRTANLLIFEDLGHLATPKSGKLNAQEELIHTLDALLADDRSVVVTASAAPAELPGLLPALQSRLTAGLTIAMMPPGVAARRQILQHFASLKNVTLPEPVADVLAEGLGGTVPEIVHSLMQLTAPAELDGEVLDVADAKRYIAKGSGKQQPTMHEIGLATARHFRLRLADLRSPVRRRALVAARGVAIYLARTIAGKSFEEIGRYLGGRDHSTIMHSCRQTQQRCENDPAIHEAITRLRKDLWKK